MPTAAAISGGASLASAGLQYFGSQNAANTMAGYGQQALAALQGILGPVLGQGESIIKSALGPLTKLLTPGAGQTAELSQMPGFQFAQTWGQNASRNQGTTLGLGGNTLAAGANYATGLAQQGYGQIVSQLQGLLNSGTGLVSNASNALAGGVSSALGSIGSAKAAGALGGANALAGGVQGLGNAGSQYFGLQSLLSRFGGGAPQSIYGTPTPGGSDSYYTGD
jgi:hypothetical protein